MVRIVCDGCYRQLDKQTEISSWTIFSFHESVKSSNRDGNYDKAVGIVHLCPKCKTARRTVYLDNPYFVEPSEDAASEQKASQSN